MGLATPMLESHFLPIYSTRVTLNYLTAVYSWLLSDARTPVWFSRWRLRCQGVVLKRLWMENCLFKTKKVLAVALHKVLAIARYMAHAVAFAAIRTTQTREHFAESSYTT